MKLQILKDAEEELDEAVDYYEKRAAELGTRFKHEARRVIQWIGEHPEVPRLRPKGYRRVNLKVFPYYIAYFIWSDTVWILAVAHGRKRPEYWIKRRPAPR